MGGVMATTKIAKDQTKQSRPGDSEPADPENNRRGGKPVDMKLEVVALGVSDVDRAKAFCGNLGWRLDADFDFGDFRVVQLTPHNSEASISFGNGVTAAAPGSLRGGLIVSDIEAAHKELVARGINASEVFHGSPFSPAGRISGPDPERQSYRSYVSFEAPDGNVGTVQEVTGRLPGASHSPTPPFAPANDLASAIRRAAAARGDHEKRNGQRDGNWPD